MNGLQFTGQDSYLDIVAWWKEWKTETLDSEEKFEFRGGPTPLMLINTSAGWVPVSPGDWVTRNPDGELVTGSAVGEARPGDTDEVLPRYLLDLLEMHLYCSTACDTAGACENAAKDHGERARLLLGHAARLHTRCRRSHKFTGAPCICSCHRKGSK